MNGFLLQYIIRSAHPLDTDEVRLCAMFSGSQRLEHGPIPRFSRAEMPNRTVTIAVDEAED